MTRTEWIPMDSELPDKEDLYLVAWRPTDRKCAYEHYYGLLQWDGDNWENATDRTGKPMKVIAWRKLPDFYKEDE